VNTNNGTTMNNNLENNVSTKTVKSTANINNGAMMDDSKSIVSTKTADFMAGSHG